MKCRECPDSKTLLLAVSGARSARKNGTQAPLLAARKEHTIGDETFSKTFICILIRSDTQIRIPHGVSLGLKWAGAPGPSSSNPANPA
jgi:hypothetical protein